MHPLTWQELITLGNQYNWPGWRDSDIGKLLETIIFLTDPGKSGVLVSRQYVREIQALLKMAPTEPEPDEEMRPFIDDPSTKFPMEG